MPKISHRGVEMPPSPIRKLVPFADAAKLRGTTVYHLNIGQPDIETPEAALNAVRNINFKTLEYSHSAGNESYRRKLVKYYSREGIEIEHTQILITTGGSEAILFAMMSCMDAGDEIIIPEPFYANYNGFAVAAGITVVPVPSYIDNGFALPEASAFEAKITSRTKAIMLCNPNNPTGYLYSRQELEQLEEIVVKHDLFLFSDEAYREFCYEGTHTSAMQLHKAANQVILMDTISKRYSACGARIGAMITRNTDVLNAALKFAQARLSPPGLGQIIGEAATDLPEDYFEEVKEEYRNRRDTLVARLNNMEGVFCPNPGGAFYAIARLPVANADHFCQWLLESFSYKGATVMLAPASGFYATTGSGKNEVRLAYVLKKEVIEAAMDCLEVALKEYRHDF